MNNSKRAVVGCLGILGLIFVGGALVIHNRDRLAASLDTQADSARATVTSTGSRILTTKLDRIDTPGPYSFTLEELTRGR